MRNPQTPEEWQEAVDTAHVLLLVQSARAYGLIRTTLDVDVGRCEEILRQGQAHGITPRPDAVERFLTCPPEEASPC